MDFMELAKRRCSARAYEDRKVEPEKLERILEAARIAPTAKNLQPVKLLAVQSGGGLVRLWPSSSAPTTSGPGPGPLTVNAPRTSMPPSSPTT